MEKTKSKIEISGQMYILSDKCLGQSGTSVTYIGLNKETDEEVVIKLEDKNSDDCSPIKYETKMLKMFEDDLNFP